MATLSRRVGGFDVGERRPVGRRGPRLRGRRRPRRLGRDDRGSSAPSGPSRRASVLLVEIAVATALAGLVYLGLSRALRIPELGTIVRLMSDALRRPASAVTVGAPTSGDPSVAWDAFVAGHPLATYLQTAAWARVKAANGWSSRLVEADPADGARVGARILLRRPRAVPWTFAYAPRGPLATPWTERRAGRLGRGAPVAALGRDASGRRRGPRPDRPRDRARRPARRRRGRSRGPRAARLATRAGGPAERHPDRRPGRRRGGPVVGPPLEVAPVRQPSTEPRGDRRGRRRRRGPGRLPGRSIGS